MKYYKRANMVLVSAMICALACNLCGCGTKTVSYSIDDTSADEGTTEASADGARAAGKLADTLGIPVSCDETDISVLTVNWIDEDYEYVRTNADGYVVSFSRLIGGACVYPLYGR